MTSYISIAVAFACALFATHLFRRRDDCGTPSLILGSLIAVFAIQAFMLTLLLEADRPYWATVLRPSLAMTIGPLIHLYFKSLSYPDWRLPTYAILHFVPAGLVAAQLSFGVLLIDIDVSIIASFAIYALALAHVAVPGGSQFHHLGDIKNAINRLAIISAALLAMSVVGEIAITTEIALGGSLDSSIPLLVLALSNAAVIAVAILLTLGHHPMSELIFSPAGVKISARATDAVDYTQCADAFETYVRENKLFISPRITISDIAAELGVTKRHLSNSINRVFEESYSRRMNRLRVEEAKLQIQSYPTKSMTEVMFDAGFRTKSSFNREFRAIMDCSPSQFRRTHRNDP